MILALINNQFWNCHNCRRRIKGEIAIIRRRYESGRKNLLDIYLPICDFWMMVDNSDLEMQIIAEGNSEGLLKIYIEDVYRKINP